MRKILFLILISTSLSAQIRTIEQNQVNKLPDSLAKKVDKIAGKGLSTNDYTNTEKSKLAGIAIGATANSTDAQLRDRSTHTGTQSISTITSLSDSLLNKVNKVTGKGLSTNDFDNTYKSNSDLNTAARHSHSNKTVLDNITAAYTIAEQTKLSALPTNSTLTSTYAPINNPTFTGTVTMPSTQINTRRVGTYEEFKAIVNANNFVGEVFVDVDKTNGNSSSKYIVYNNKFQWVFSF